MSPAQPVPEGYPQLSPYYLCVDGAARAIDFYVDVLAATERMRMAGPDGSIATPSWDSELRARSTIRSGTGGTLPPTSRTSTPRR